MAKHEFGIMEIAPIHGQRYDEYEPQKYNCIVVDDIFLENNLGLFSDIDTYSHTLDVPIKGLAYCGVTLLPPTSLNAFISKINGLEGLQELRDLLCKAHEKKKYVIHFGL